MEKMGVYRISVKMKNTSLKENCGSVTAVLINPPHKGEKNKNATYHKNLEIALRRCSDGHMLAAHLLA